MARKTAERKIVDVKDIPADAIGAVVLADLAQIAADAKTHPDSDAQRRILFAVERLTQIAEGNVSADLVASLPC